jgi:hypothetical protein
MPETPNVAPGTIVASSIPKISTPASPVVVAPAIPTVAPATVATPASSPASSTARPPRASNSASPIDAATSKKFLERIAAENYEQWAKAPNVQRKYTTLDAYWDAQPPEVQVLKNMRNEGDRAVVARELADMGFQIDVPIMVQGYDPLTIMLARQKAGYTWVPSAKMDPVRIAPGLSMPGIDSYDAKNPPPGAIMVSTDFAKGSEREQTWLTDD